MGSSPHDTPGARLLEAVAVMDTLRRECPWDREQTHESLLPYLIEEAYELVEAVEVGDAVQRREELGDVLLQVLFHARVAAEDETDPFDIDDVASGLVDKLRRRHPHVFGDADVASAAEVQANWEQIKRAEKGRQSALDGIPSGLPALSLASAVIARTVAAGGDLSVPVPDATPDEAPTTTAERLGDVLFALVAAAHAAGIDPEHALRTRVRAEMIAVRDAEQRGLPGEAEPRR